MKHNTINFNIEKQNSKEMLDLLSAQRNIYSSAKIISLYIFIISIIPVVLKIFIKNENLTNYSNLVSVIITFLLLSILDNKVKTAASIQEMFDVKLFGLPKNTTLVSNKINIGIINKNSKNTNRAALFNWYPKPKTDNNNINVLIRQFNNTVWNLMLNKLCRNILLVLFIAIILSYFILIFFISANLVNSYYITLLPLFITLIKYLINFYKTVKNEEELYKNIKKHINRKSISIEYLRQVQDRIYLIRYNSNMVPNFIYKMTHKKNELIMKKYTEEINKSIE